MSASPSGGGRSPPRLIGRVEEPPATNVWVYWPCNGKTIAFRSGPAINAPTVGLTLSPGQDFVVSEERSHDGVIFLRCAHGRGWLFDTKPGMGTMCIRASQFQQVARLGAGLRSQQRRYIDLEDGPWATPPPRNEVDHSDSDGYIDPEEEETSPILARPAHREVVPGVGVGRMPVRSYLEFEERLYQFSLHHQMQQPRRNIELDFEGLLWEESWFGDWLDCFGCGSCKSWLVDCADCALDLFTCAWCGGCAPWISMLVTLAFVALFLIFVQPTAGWAAASVASDCDLRFPVLAANGIPPPAVALCTMITQPSHDIDRLLESIQLFMPDSTVYVATTDATGKEIAKDFPKLRFVMVDRLAKYKRFKNRNVMTAAKVWLPFQMEKAFILRKALADGYPGAWYMDADTFLIAPLPYIKQQVALSPHRIDKNMMKAYGTWNGGYLFVRNMQVLDDWEAAAPFGRSACCQDQTALDAVAAKWQYENMSCGVNVGWWQLRASHSLEHRDMHDDISCKQGRVMFKDCKLYSMHYHIGEPQVQNVLMDALRECKSPLFEKMQLYR